MPHQGNGMFAVGLMALHDREFFSALLENPEAAIAAKRAEGRLLHVTPQDVEQVRSALEERRARGGADPLEMWDHWTLTGEWHLRDWPVEWPFPIRPLQ